MKLNLLLITAFCLQIISNLSAQTPCSYNVVTRQFEGDCPPSVIVTAVPFLRITPDGRGAGMGDAGIAISADANTMYYNSSKMAFATQKTQLSATYTPWLRSLGLNDIYLAYLSGFTKFDSTQGIGFGLRYFSLGQIAFTNENGEPAGEGKPNEFEALIGYSRRLSNNLAIGLSGKFIYSDLASGKVVDGIEIAKGIAGAADLSMTYRKPFKKGGDLMVGVAMTNIGSKITYTRNQSRDFIPSNLGIGAAYSKDMDAFNKITFALDINKLLTPTPTPAYTDENGNSINDWREKSMFSGLLGSFSDAEGGFKEEVSELMYNIGVEYVYNGQFAVRAGYVSEDKFKGNRKYLTVGLGLKYNVFGINLAYLVGTSNQRNPLDNTLRFSLLLDFNQGKTTNEEIIEGDF
jgi:hypothetical protein